MSAQLPQDPVLYPWLDAQTPAQMTERYIELRDAKKRFEDGHKAEVRTAFTNEMDEIEARLLNFLEASGSESIRSTSGTAYRYTASSVTLADVRAFQRHVIGAEAWQLVEWRVSKTAVNEMVESGEVLPPGVNYSPVVKVGIRRPEK